jgi:hypothetical protein
MVKKYENDFKVMVVALLQSGRTAREHSVLNRSIGTINYVSFAGDSISDLTGIEDFNALRRLTCLGTQLTTLDLSQNNALNNL